MNKKIAVITLDGPGGTGKGTVGQLLAARLGWNYLESGILYRALAFVAMKKNVEFDQVSALIGLLKSMDLQLVFVEDNFRVFIEHVDVTDDLQNEECGNLASKVAAIPEIRYELLQKQRDFRQPPGLVTDGRDMGTVVFPDADLKFFLLADQTERAKRRYNQLKEKGINVSLDTILKELTERDLRDQNRAISPLKPATDAIVIDTTLLSVDQVLKQIMHWVEKILRVSILDSYE